MSAVLWCVSRIYSNLYILFMWNDIAGKCSRTMTKIIFAHYGERSVCLVRIAMNFVLFFCFSYFFSLCKMIQKSVRDFPLAMCVTPSQNVEQNVLDLSVCVCIFSQEISQFHSVNLFWIGRRHLWLVSVLRHGLKIIKKQPNRTRNEMKNFDRMCRKS